MSFIYFSTDKEGCAGRLTCAGGFLVRRAFALVLVVASAVSSPAFSAEPRLVVQVGHLQWINALALSKDGQLVASGGRDRSLKIWSMQSGQELSTVRAPGEVIGVAFSPSADSRCRTSAMWLRSAYSSSAYDSGTLTRTVALGEVADVITTGQRVVPKRSLGFGYNFKFPQIDAALKDILG